MSEDDNFLSRWSRRKTQARTSPAEPAPPPVAPPEPAAATEAGAAASLPGEREALPPVESLTTESDFAPFMAPEVDAELRREALKTLFADPRFNVMDMMDVYVDDYSRPDPIPESWLAKMEQMSWRGDRGGRDREEAERRKAAEQAQAQAQAPGDAPTEDAPAGAAESPPAGEISDRTPVDAGAPPTGMGAATAADTPGAAIPPPKLRESSP